MYVRHREWMVRGSDLLYKEKKSKGTVGGIIVCGWCYQHLLFIIHLSGATCRDLTVLLITETFFKLPTTRLISPLSFTTDEIPICW